VSDDDNDDDGGSSSVAGSRKSKTTKTTRLRLEVGRREELAERYDCHGTLEVKFGGAYGPKWYQLKRAACVDEKNKEFPVILEFRETHPKVTGRLGTQASLSFT
jgi:hypothetical protein